MARVRRLLELSEIFPHSRGHANAGGQQAGQKGTAMGTKEETEGGDKFTAITSQEQLNTIIADRIKRAEAKAVEKFADYDDLKAKAEQFDQQQDSSKTAEQKHASELAKLQKQIDGLTGKLSESESTAMKARIQAKHKISDDDAALFLTATDSDGLERQAVALAKRDADRKRGAPYVPQQEGHTDPVVNEDSAFAQKLFGGGD